MQWTKEKIKNHIQAACLLTKVKDDVLQYLKNNLSTSEYAVRQFILQQFKKYKLKNEVFTPIVAFRQNTSFVHYHPSQYCLKLKANSLILLDIWARLNKKNSPYADMTWMAFYGRRVPMKILKIFNIVLKARDKCITFLRSQLRQGSIPTGKKVDAIARNFITQNGYSKNFLHSTGHSLGFTSPHGLGARLNTKDNRRLNIKQCYTIEPGIYIKNRFGIRSEIDFFIDDNMRLITTTPAQKKLTKITNKS